MALKLAQLNDTHRYHNRLARSNAQNAIAHDIGAGVNANDDAIVGSKRR